MTVGRLISELQGMDEHAEVRLAQQPEWPFEYSLGEVIWSGDHDPADGYEAVRDDEGWWVEDTTEGEQVDGPFEDSITAIARINELVAEAGTPPNVVYLAEAGQLDYLPAWASRTLGWK